MAWRTLATARSFIFSCGLRNVACETCVKDNTDEITADGKIDYEAHVQRLVINFDLSIEESSSFDSWSVCVWLTNNFPMQSVLGACFTSDPKWKVACETRGEDNMVWAVCVITVDYEADTSDSFSPGGAVDVCYGTTSSPIREPVWLVMGPTTDAKSGASHSERADHHLSQPRVRR